MALTEVTDPKLLSQLNGQAPANKKLTPVTDPETLKQLNGQSQPNVKQIIADQITSDPLKRTQNESYVKSVAMAPFRVGKDLGDAIFQRMSEIPKYVEASKTEIPGLINLIRHEPMSVAKQAGAGLAEQAQKLLNARPEFMDYATNRLGLLPPIAPGGYPKQPDVSQSINEIFGKPTKAGEALVRGTFRNFPEVVGGVELAATAAPYLNPMNIPRALKSTSGLKAQLKEAEQGVNAAEEAETAESRAAIREHNVGNVDSLINKKNAAIEKLNDLHKQLSDNPPKTMEEYVAANQKLEEHTKNYEDAKLALDQAKSASVQEINLSDVDKIKNRINQNQATLDKLMADKQNGKPVTQEQIDAAKSDLESAKIEHKTAVDEAESTFGTSKQNALQKKINDNSAKISELETKLAEHKEPVAEGELKEVPDTKDFAENETRSSAYHENAQQMVQQAENEVAQHLNPKADHAMRVSRAMKHDIKSINEYWSNAYQSLMDKLKKTKFNLASRMPDISEYFISTDNDELINLLKKSPTVEDVNASDFMAKQKDFRDARYNLLQRYKTEPSAVMRDKLMDAYNKSKPVQDIISKTLEDGLGEHKPEYQRVNGGYANEVFPLRENRVAQKIMDGERLSEDMAKEFTGDEVGQNLLKEIAQRNPEVKRNIMGQQYKKAAKDKANFYDPDETVREYINTMPDLERLISRRERAMSAADEAKANLDRSKALHDEAKANRAAIEKENVKKAKAQEEERARVAKEKEAHLKEIKDLQEKNSLLGGIKQKLAEASKNKNELESYHKDLTKLKTHQDNVQQSITETTDELERLNKHLKNIETAQQKLAEVGKPAKVKAGKEPDIASVKTQIEKLTKKLTSLDDNISKLEKAKSETDLKLAKKVEIEKQLDEAKATRKEARRRLKVAGAAIAVMSGGKAVYSISDYLLQRKND